ncbi:flagellar biosynthesis protein FlhF [Paenibacillus sp. R14(2021)]|uniref:flagellar biosynthesis protein FlhF n=1 Tax=Paenibacillus sp. R14(2021) TaxID=2859228 RepID=UPI001C615BDD|nr:flagellar biosynthesis protein FlhF [Paenibacillus sp. R14(2021)]
MKVKRYIVNALPEALPMIRSELGMDAVILNTKEIRVGGFLGMFGKKKTEVIAAVETNTSASTAKPAARTQAQTSGKPAITPEVIASMAASLSSAAANREQAGGAGTAPSSTTAVMTPPLPETVRKSGPAAVYEARTAAIAELPETAPIPKKSQVSEDALMEEIRDMKQWIVRMSKQQQVNAWPEAIQALNDRLLDQEVSQPWVDKLVTTIEEQLALTGQLDMPDRTSVWEIAARTLLDWLKDFGAAEINKNTRVIHFVGPTGVGKTTSIAKLAAEQTLKAGRKVGFITSDTYRIAAVDQLRTYATILNVPLEVVFSPSEVARAFRQLEDRELIFMDTAGRNFRNELYVSEVNSLLQPGRESETFLVLSLTGKFSDMSKVAENFSKFGINRVLYTKQDETHANGAILNLALGHGLRPTYIAYGQTVPDDIAVFQAAGYVAQLLGDPHGE